MVTLLPKEEKVLLELLHSPLMLNLPLETGEALKGLKAALEKRHPKVLKRIQEDYEASLKTQGRKQNQKEGERKAFKEIECGYNQILRIHQHLYKGKELLSIQKFWRKEETDPWELGKGVTFPYEAIDGIIEGLQTMQEALAEDTPQGK